MAQIQDKYNTMPFEMDGQEIIRIGMNFSSKKRNIEKYIVGWRRNHWGTLTQETYTEDVSKAKGDWYIFFFIGSIPYCD